MNYPVIINDNYVNTDFHFEPILDAYGNPTKYCFLINTYLYNNTEHLNYKRLRLSILDAQTGMSIKEFYRNIDFAADSLYIMQNGQEFIITSGDFQCISIYNITKNEFKDYVYGGEDAYKICRGFCPTFYEWDQFANTLVVHGSVYDGPPEILTIFNVDLNNITFQEIGWECYNEGE